jgi:vanillate O-demethylase ferredoxin subunit
MASHMRAQGRSFALHYSGRSRGSLAFLSELAQIAGTDLQVYADNEPNRSLDVTVLLSAQSIERPVYVCGPTGLIDKVIAEAQRLGWSNANVHFEHFSAAAPQSGDECFEVELGQSGRRFSIPAHKTILDVLIEAGVDVIYDCKRGDCGICQVGVLQGEPDHRDYILSEAEQAAGKVMQICISRSRSTVLVLDL